MLQKLARRILLIASLCTLASAQTLTFTNDSGVGDFQHFFVGNAWTMTITGAVPYSSVTIAAWHNNEYLGSTPFDPIDEFGEWHLPGTMPAWALGDWVEIVSVGGTQVSPTLEFNVSEVPSCEVSYTGGPSLNFQVTEYWLPNDTDEPTFSHGNLPWIISHQVSSGPCVYESSYHNTTSGHITADDDPQSFVNGHYKKLQWTFTDSENHGSYPNPRCNPHEYLCRNPAVEEYFIYDYGSVQTVFAHEHGSQYDVMVTTSYQFVIHAERID